MPAVLTRAEAKGVVALREPLGGDPVREVVVRLVEAWQKGSLDALASLLTSDAGPIELRARGNGALVESWRQRLHAHEYTRLSGLEVVRPERIERWTWDELGPTGGGPVRPGDMRPDELYLRVPLEVTHLGGEKLFEDAIVLVVRREGGRYRIAAYGEVGAQ
jgi:hypothetical protein